MDTTTAAQPAATSTDLLDGPRVEPPTASGSFVTRGQLFCDPEQVETQVAELQAQVERGTTPPPPEGRQALLELWLDVEPFLTSEERAMLGSGTFEVLFPNSGQPRLNRCGQLSGGGS